ncbi:uncharacterized protein LOC144647595 [Oculina patagonica]
MQLNTKSERPVCMKAKGDSPGVFYTTKAGLITAFKLVHISGEVGCVWNGRSKWGCTDPYKIATLITDDQNNIVFPENGRYSYTIPGFGSNSPELMLNFSTPLVVTADQEFRVWYSEDLGGTDIDNYPGPTLLSLQPISETLKSIQRNTNFRFAHFIDHFFHVLDVPELESTLVTDRNVCLRRCLKDQRCFSTNLAANPDIKGNYVCELLPTDKYNASNSFGPSQYFHHYSLKTACSLDPCKHNSTCHALYEQDDYWCECLPLYLGKNCEKWFAEIPGEVCMGAKGNTPGVFLTPMAGKIDLIKLVHISGLVGCDPFRRSRWGCTSGSSILTILTDDKNKVIFPEDHAVRSHTIPGFHSDSSELVFTFTTPLVVTAGQEYRLWYTEDLLDYYEWDNSGPTCMKVMLLLSP